MGPDELSHICDWPIYSMSGCIVIYSDGFSTQLGSFELQRGAEELFIDMTNRLI